MTLATTTTTPPTRRGHPRQHAVLRRRGQLHVAVIDTTKLDPKNYNPDEKLINVGLSPRAWPSARRQAGVVGRHRPPDVPVVTVGISVISTASDKSWPSCPCPNPQRVAFSPSGRGVRATSAGCGSTARRRASAQVIRGLGEPRSVASPPTPHRLGPPPIPARAVISAANNTVTRTINGELPCSHRVADARPSTCQPTPTPSLSSHTPEPHHSSQPNPPYPQRVRQTAPHRDRAQHGHRCRRRRYQPGATQSYGFDPRIVLVTPHTRSSSDGGDRKA